MGNIIQLNCKGLGARHEEVQVLMNKIQPNCICLKELMLENNEYSIGREYKGFATIPPDQRNKESTAITI